MNATLFFLVAWCRVSCSNIRLWHQKAQFDITFPLLTAIVSFDINSEFFLFCVIFTNCCIVGSVLYIDKFGLLLNVNE